jgi:tyrosinase
MATDLRKNAATLSPAERQNFLRAILLLRRTPASGNPNVTIYDQFVALHGAVMSVAVQGTPDTINFGHWNIGFCAWHREYLRRFELELQKLVPGVTVPYWDWSNHTQARTRIFINDFMGPLLTPIAQGAPRPMTTGFFSSNGPTQTPAWLPANAKGWRIPPSLQEIQYPATNPNRQTLQSTLHRGSSGETWPPSSAQMTHLSQLNVSQVGYHKFWFFWNQLEAGMPDVTPPFAAIPTHNAAHRFIGGHMGGAYSPNDPIFWLHHANVDRIWAQWQKFQLGIGGSHPRSADYPPITQSDPWNNDPIPLGHRLNDEMWPWVTNPGNFSAEVDPQITALLTGFPQTPVRKVSDVLDPVAMGYDYA